MAEGEVTLLLASLRRGEQDALGRLMPLVYDELRRLAGHYMRGERAGHTLQPTAVVHESVSADEKTILFTVTKQQNRDLMMVEDFR